MRIDLSSVSNLARAKPELQKLEKATEQIETIFVKQLLEQMQKGTKTFGEGPQADIYSDFFNQAIAESTAKHGLMGVGKMLYRQLAPRIVAQAAASSTLSEKV